LLRIAKLRADELAAQIAQLEHSKSSAENAIDWLNKAVAAEERGSGASPEALRQFQSYLQGAELKRRSLAATRARLSVEIDQMRGLAAEASVEIRKFEHLLALKSAAAALARSRDEAATADEAVVQARAHR
jgi:flagellar export protein FliJ